MLADKVPTSGQLSELRDLDAKSLAILVLLVTSIWILVIIVYRLYFHPLAKYPGPWLAKVSDLYNVYHCFIGDRHLEFNRIHRLYGDMVRYGPNRVSINTSTALHTIYNPQANTQKSSLFLVFPKFFHAWSTQTMIDTATYQHKAKRKVLNHALSDKTLVQLEAKTLPIIRRFCSMVGGKEAGVENGEKTGPADGWSSSKDMAKLMGYLSFDVMGQICFGSNFQILEKESNRYILRVAIEGARCLNTVGHMQAVLYTGLHNIIFRRLLKGLRSYQDFSSGLCDRQLEEKRRSKSDNVFSHLCSASHPDREAAPLYTDQELRCETSLLILAGSDTTATCMAASLFYMLNNPHVLQRAQHEVRTTFGDLEEIRGGPLLSSCTYLRACIDESLRMSPPVGGLMPREVKRGGIVIDGHFFAEDTEVGTPIYAIQHKERYFPDPFTYDPSRWLAKQDGNGGDDDATRQASHQLHDAKSAFCAWSVGNRSCVGRSMAYLEMGVVLGRLLWSYDMRLSGHVSLGGGAPDLEDGRRRRGEYQLWDAFASNNYGPMVDFKARDTGPVRDDDSVREGQ